MEKEDDSEVVGGLRPGETLCAADGQIFRAQCLHHVGGGSSGDKHLLLELTLVNASAVVLN